MYSDGERSPIQTDPLFPRRPCLLVEPQPLEVRQRLGVLVLTAGVRGERGAALYGHSAARHGTAWHYAALALHRMRHCLA